MSKNSLENLRHSLAHLLGAAVLELYPGSKLAIGPAIDDGFYYDIDVNGKISDTDLPRIETEMTKILKTWDKFEEIEETQETAKLRYLGNPYKTEIIAELISKGDKITSYQSGKFIDLCRGGHVASAKDIKPNSFKLSRVAGAYWRGDEKNPQLTRIYGYAFETKKELEEYLAMLEEAKKRDHRILGEQLELFTFAKEVGSGLPLWLPKGTILREEIEKFAKEVEDKWGYQRVTTPHIAKEDLYRMSGHIPYYAESMYPAMKLDDGNYYLKAMNCPHTHMIYRAKPHSYRELPLRYSEYGTVYRYELSGTLAGLLRTRGFTQNDAHIYCTEEQVEEEFLNVMKLHEFWYKEVFGIKDFYMRLSLPAQDKEKFAGMPDGWKKAVEIILRVMKKSGLPYEEAEGEAAFYGPKVDFQIKSAIGREETASTNQLDFLATERFNLKYIDSDGKEKPVYVIHRAPLGSHERFIAFLIEHYAGAFPTWLSPVQVAILPISDNQEAWSIKVYKKLKEAGVRVELDNANETLGKKIRNAEKQKIPYLLVIGDKEAQAGSVAVRQRGKGDMGQMELDKFLETISDEIKERT